MSEQIPTPQLGMRCRVTSVPLRHGASVVDQLGTIVRFESLDLGPLELADGPHDGHFDDVPVIRLDSGRELRGWECWWTPAEEATDA